MVKVTKQQIWQFLSVDCNDDATYTQYVEQLDADQPAEFAITEEQFTALRDAKRDGELTAILADQGFSETHPGGDTVIGIVEDVLDAQSNGMSVVTWYGPSSECLVATYNDEVLQVAE